MTRRTHHTLRGTTRPALTLLAVFALVASAAPLPAQPVAGERVRVVPHGETGRYVARVVRLRGDTLWLERGAARGTRPDTTFAIPLIDVRRMERSTGARRHVRRNALIGAAAGGALGGIVGAASGGATEFDSQGDIAFFSAMVFAMPGAGIGALTGLRRTERWERVSLAAPASRGAASSGGARLAPRLRPVRVPRRDGTWARALALGVTLRVR